VDIGKYAVNIAGILQNRELYNLLLKSGFEGVCTTDNFPLTSLFPCPHPHCQTVSQSSFMGWLNADKILSVYHKNQSVSGIVSFPLANDDESPYPSSDLTECEWLCLSS
jgi:hypothetical protein